MASAYCILLFLALLLLQFSIKSDAREIISRNPKNDHDNVVKTEENLIRIHSKNDHIDPALNVFFNVNDLYAGKKMPIYFAINNPSATPHLLPREEADSIPFSSSKLSHLLQFFDFSEDSPQAKAIEVTLKQCEIKPTGGEIKFCATSLESLLDSTRGILGVDKFKVLTTKIQPFPNSNFTLLQEYTFLKKPLEVHAASMVACHTMAYPYLVYYCHGQKSQNRVFQIDLGGEDGSRVEAVAICHMDTSSWDPDHVAFRVLGGRPGSSPVCHFLPADNLAWIPST